MEERAHRASESTAVVERTLLEVAESLEDLTESNEAGRDFTGNTVCRITEDPPRDTHRISGEIVAIVEMQNKSESAAARSVSHEHLPKAVSPGRTHA